MKENLSAFVYFAGWRLVRWLPEKTAYNIAYVLGDYLVKRNGRNVARFRSNLSRTQVSISSSDLDDLLKRAMRSYMRYWIDTFRFPDWSMQRVQGTVSVTNEHLMLDAIAAKTGVIVSLPHAGNWDHAGAYFCAKGIHLVTVAERLKPEKLFLKFLKYRQDMGMEVLPLDSQTIGVLETRLRQGHLVALVADRDLSKSGIEVEFFDGPTRMPAGPAVLALQTQAPLITAFVSYTPEGIHVEFKNVLIPSQGEFKDRVKEIVSMTAKHFEEGIRNNPEDWHMLQRIWTDGDFKDGQ